MTNVINEFLKSLPRGRCKDCQFSRCVFGTGNFMFLGCHHKPYHGKWVAEIKDCPKEGEE
jgi:hypothetical protein